MCQPLSRFIAADQLCCRLVAHSEEAVIKRLLIEKLYFAVAVAVCGRLCLLIGLAYAALFLQALSPAKFASRNFLICLLLLPMKPNLNSQHLKA